MDEDDVMDEIQMLMGGEIYNIQILIWNIKKYEYSRIKRVLIRPV